MHKLFIGQIKLQVILALLLCFLTIVIFNNFNKYDYTGGELINNPAFSNDLLGWEKSKSSDAISVEESSILKLGDLDKKMTVSIKQYIKPAANQQSFMFSIDIKSEGILQGYRRWEKAHIIVAGIDDLGRTMFEEPHFLVSQAGNSDWRKYVKIIRINKSIQRYFVSVQITNAKGVVKVRDLSLRPVAEKNIYKMYWLLMIFLWISLMVWITYSYFFSCDLEKGAKFNILLICFVAVVVLMPQNLSNEFVNKSLSIFSWGKQAYAILLDSGIMDKIEHVSLFFLLALRLFWNKKSISELFSQALLLLLIALVSEVLQLLTNDRNLEVYDLVADMSGIVAAVIFWLFLDLIKNGKNTSNACVH